MIKYNGKLMKEIWVDIDGTLAKTEGHDYAHAIPIKEAIDKVNSYYYGGCYIKVWTGRGTNSHKDWNALTIQQLSDWKLKYHELRFERKPDMLVDNIAINSRDFIK